MHILIFLKEPHKLLTPDNIDSCISANWPDPETLSYLKQLRGAWYMGLVE